MVLVWQYLLRFSGSAHPSSKHHLSISHFPWTFTLIHPLNKPYSSISLLSLSTAPFLLSSSWLWFSFSVTLLVFQWGKNTAFSSFSAFISTISVFFLKYHNFTFSLLFTSVPQETFNCFPPWKYCQVSSLCFLNSNWQFTLTKKWVFYD